ncbi:MAG: TldD/PmbA family protein [Dehalococcoidia bacterium]|nr:TldD/PmbA family protein [Dehalococcoidia bacterium]MDD5493655.1 TldD/PmbA family protein [Dehalococcoidia bacterium]
MEEILDRAQKAAEKAEVFQVLSHRTPVHFEANRLKQIQTKETVGTALRLVKNGRLGFAQVGGMVNAGELIDMALETSSFGTEVNFEFPAGQSYRQTEIYDPAVEKVTIGEMIELGQKLVDAVASSTPGIQCEATVSRSITTCRIANTQGGHAYYTKSSYSISVEGVLVKNGDLLFVGDSRSSCRPIIDHRLVTEEVLKQLENARRNAAITSGVVPVIFTPMGVAGALLSPLISAFNGKTVFDGASPLKDKKGAKVFDEGFSLTDDPTIPYQPGSAPFDDEGVATRSSVLIGKGVVNQFYYDLRTAALAGTVSTGNGNRNGGLPSPSPHALVIDSGQVSQQDMINDIKQGLVIEQLMGAEQGNILNGDFSGNVLLGYKIENGEIAGRVKDTMVFGNIYQLLSKLEALGNDSRWIAGYARTPSIYLPAISVSAKSG